MQESALDTQAYKHTVDDLLHELKNQVDRQTLAAASEAGLNSLDEYLLELNTFYYKSFHNRFFPHYEQIIQEDIRNLLHLSQDEAILKQNILALLKRYARLCNRVKHTSALWERKRQETQALRSECSQGSEERNVSLLYYLKEMYGNWNSFLTLIQNIQAMQQDDLFMAALKQYPPHAAAANLIAAWNPENSRETRDFNRLLASWKLSTRLLGKLQDDPSPSRESYETLMQEIKQADLNWDNRKVNPVVRTWYQQYIQQAFRLYWECLNLNAEKRDSRLISKAARQFEEWLNSLLTVIEQSMLYKSRGWEELAVQADLLAKIDKACLNEMDSYTSRLLQSMDELIQSLSISNRADYRNHSQRAGALLNLSSERLQEELENKSIPRSSIIKSALERLKYQNEYLETGIELLNDKEDHSVNTRSQCQAILDALDSYLELLTNIKDELNRMLSPRHLKNIFQNIDLKMEHALILPGASFPSQYNYLIVEKMIETEVSDMPGGQILYTEGDIFVFHLDDSIVYEIPKIIVAKRG